MVAIVGAGLFQIPARADGEIGKLSIWDNNLRGAAAIATLTAAARSSGSLAVTGTRRRLSRRF